MNPILPLKQRFFSSDQSGVVITSDDFVALNEKLGFDLPKKSTDAILVETVAQVKRAKKEQDFAKHSSQMVKNRADELVNLIKPYKYAQEYYTIYIEKAERFAEDLRNGVELD